MGSCCSRPATEDDSPIDQRDEATETTRLLPERQETHSPPPPPLTPQERQLLENQEQWRRIVSRTADSFLDIAAVRSVERPGATSGHGGRESRENEYRSRVSTASPPDLSMLRADRGMTLVRPAPLWEVEDKGGVLQAL